MTREKALQISLDLWTWLFKNPGKYKWNWPNFHLIDRLSSDCALCELYYCVESCHKCPLDIINCLRSDSPYEKWEHAVDLGIDKWYIKPAAAKIAATIRRALRKESS